MRGRRTRGRALVRLKARRFYRVSGTKKWTAYYDGDQRFNFKREDTRTSYLAQDIRTCVREVRARGIALLATAYAAPVEVTLAVWDLRQPKSELDAGIAPLVRGLRHHPLVKRLGSRARKAGIHGILYESVRTPGKACLAVFLENVEPRRFRKGTWKPLP
ncbi:MAG TPA: RES family NAD+ phosphorylase [Planctomycetota bacterium]|nr:RES family NAD+ phosphorylase [Planctomycetota bacterium]